MTHCDDCGRAYNDDSTAVHECGERLVIRDDACVRTADYSARTWQQERADVLAELDKWIASYALARRTHEAEALRRMRVAIESGAHAGGVKL